MLTLLRHANAPKVCTAVACVGEIPRACKTLEQLVESFKTHTPISPCRSKVTDVRGEVARKVILWFPEPLAILGGAVYRPQLVALIDQVVQLHNLRTGDTQARTVDTQRVRATHTVRTSASVITGCMSK